MPVHELNPSDTRAVKGFVRLEHELAKGPPLHVAPTGSDLRKQLSGKSAFFDQMAHTLFVGSNGERDVAHCAALINRRWQQSHDEHETGFIGYFGAVGEAGPEVSELLSRAEEWLARRGMRTVIAPLNGAAFLGMGVQVDAFDESPMFPLHWTPPHHAAYFEAAGYAPTGGLMMFWIDFDAARYREATRAALEQSPADIRPVDKRRWNDELELLRDLLNDSFRDMWQFQQHTADEFAEVYGALKPILDPREMLFAEVKGETVGFALGLPDLTPLFRSFDGKLGPIRVIRLLRGAKRYERAGLIGIGIRDAHRGTGIAQALATRLYRRYQELGFRGAFYYPVNEENQRSRSFAESLGGHGRRVYSCFEKRLV